MLIGNEIHLLFINNFNFYTAIFRTPLFGIVGGDRTTFAITDGADVFRFYTAQFDEEFGDLDRACFRDDAVDSIVTDRICMTTYLYYWRQEKS